jgi:hypothetical protein
MAQEGREVGHVVYLHPDRIGFFESFALAVVVAQLAGPGALITNEFGRIIWPEWRRYLPCACHGEPVPQECPGFLVGECTCGDDPRCPTCRGSGDVAAYYCDLHGHIYSEECPGDHGYDGDAALLRSVGALT